MCLEVIKNMDIELRGFEPGSSLTIMGTSVKKFRDEYDKYHEALTLVYKDTTTNLKYKTEIIDPLYEFYRVKPGNRVRYNRLYIECDSYRVPRVRLDKYVADSVSLSKWYKECIRNGDRAKIKTIHKHPDVFMSDNNIEDHYRFWFNIGFKNEICSITKSFFDIEVDTIEIGGQFPEPGQCPINAITVLFSDRMEMYTFLLKSKRNLAQITQFEQDLSNGKIEEFKQFILNHVSENNRVKGTNLPNYFGLEKLKINVLFYDEDREIDLINDAFGIINQIKPDFCEAWNQSFDIPYVIARCKVLGYNPESIICHPDFENKQCYYYIDEKNKNEYEERCDFFACSSYTIYLDQMIQFASRRKGQTKFLNYKLDYIGEVAANVRKLDYKDITDKLEELPYKNYGIFVLYNMCDTVVQHCIECCTNDLEYVFGKVIMNNTRYSKVHRQTVYLTNRGQKVLWENGYVKGNNANLDNVKVPYPGAFVADPKKVNNRARLFINGFATNIFNNLVDSDFKSLYPSIIRAFNDFGHTQIGMIIIDQVIHAKENRTHYEYYTRGGQYIEDLQSHSWLEFAERWFGLLGFKDLVEFVRYIYTVEIKPSSPMCNNKITFNDNTYMPIIQQPKYYMPIVQRQNKKGYYRPIIMEPEMSDELKNRLEEWLNHVAVEPNQSF